MNTLPLENLVAEQPPAHDFARLDAGRFDVEQPPEKPVPILSLCGQGISTAGNLTIFGAQLKSAKTTTMMAAVASIMGGTGDCLGFTGISTGGAWVHLDTEQSPYDFDRAVRTALRRAGREVPPDWTRLYSTVHLDVEERREMLFAELERAYNEYGGILGASVDGVADLCRDPNDALESFALVARLHRAAVEYECPIIVSLHENPGVDNGKTRGHLGSELARKAETNLQLAKDASGVVTLFTERSRSVYISKDSGPRFTWNNEAVMFMSCDTKRAEQSVTENFTMQAIVDEIFCERTSMKYSELKREIKRVKGVQDTAAENLIRKLVPSFVQKNLLGMYEKS